MKKRALRDLERVVIFSLGALFFFAAPARSATLSGQSIVGGGTVEIHFPVAKYFQDIASKGGNPRAETGRAVLAFPPGFNPARTWPILIVTSTSDFHITSPMDVKLYRDAAMSEGWVILAPDATIKPRIDSTQWRLGMLAAALDTVWRQWPQSAQWPVAFAGFSGGAKRTGTLGSMLAVGKPVNVRGFFLAGINEDRLAAGYKTFHPARNFLNVPIWLSSGANDRIATPTAHASVRSSLEHAGFQNVRLEQFKGVHEVQTAEVRRALRWFREVGGF
ncbi:MAG: hypothetical protein M3O82_03845 [Verrucomicrobiota bacterium]|nr:hypothetical protein [Verrucomicrobiota bacterium]